MSTIGVRSDRDFFECAFRKAADFAIVSIALMGGILLNAAWFAHVPLGLHGDDYWRFGLLTATLLAVTRKWPSTGFWQRGLDGLAASCFSFCSYSALSLICPGILGSSIPTLAVSVGLGILFAVTARVRPRSVSNSSAVDLKSVVGLKSPIKNVLVIGGAGHIGSALVPKLLAQGYRVRVLDKLIFGCNPLSAVLNHRNFDLHQGDFRDLNTVIHAMSGMHAVIHLGAVQSDPAHSGDDESVIQANVITTRLIASCAKAVHVSRFIYASTCSVYGSRDEFLDEDSPVCPLTLFARIKAESEVELRALSGKKFHPTILRFGTVYGVGGRSRFDLVINFLVAAAKMPGTITLTAADHRRPFVHVEDVAKAITSTLQAPADQVCGETMNVGSESQSKTLTEIARIICKNAPDARLEVKSSCPEIPDHRVGFCKIEARLGFEPSWTLEAGIKQVVETLEFEQPIEFSSTEPSKAHLLAEDMDFELISGDSPGFKSISIQTMLY